MPSHALVAAAIAAALVPADACTGISLSTTGGEHGHGRTIEWGHFDLKSRLVGIASPAKGSTRPGARPAASTSGGGAILTISSARTPLGRLGDARDIAYTALFLCSPAACG